MARVIEQVDPRSAPAMALLREAALEARALYPELFTPGTPMPTNPPAAERTVYLVVYDEHVASGCAALRPLDAATAEVRRVYVSRGARRNGLARALMGRLEDEAVALGYSALKLETGDRQLPAMRLYESLGYRRIPAFGPYAGDRPCGEFQLVKTPVTLKAAQHFAADPKPQGGRQA